MMFFLFVIRLFLLRFTLLSQKLFDAILFITLLPRFPICCFQSNLWYTCYVFSIIIVFVCICLILFKAICDKMVGQLSETLIIPIIFFIVFVYIC